jgi:hypothetical protein
MKIDQIETAIKKASQVILKYLKKSNNENDIKINCIIENFIPMFDQNKKSSECRKYTKKLLKSLDQLKTNGPDVVEYLINWFSHYVESKDSISKIDSFRLDQNSEPVSLATYEISTDYHVFICFCTNCNLDSSYSSLNHAKNEIRAFINATDDDSIMFDGRETCYSNLDNDCEIVDGVTIHC